jgi:archaellum component FlaC
MNPLIITIIAATGTFILAIFGATWLNHQLLKSYIDAKFEGLENTIDSRFDAVDARFDAVDARFESVDARFESVERQMALLGSRVERLERQLDQIFKSFLPRL